LKYAEKHVKPKGTFRERKPPKTHSSYMELMCDIIDSDPSIFEEASK
jgi:hypothetical protein